MRRKTKTKMTLSWEIRYQEQAGKLRVLVDDLECLHDIKEKLDCGLNRLFAVQHTRALLCVESLDGVPAILLENPQTRRLCPDVPADIDLYGAAPEAVKLLYPRSIGMKALKQLARMAPRRQIQVARLMLASGCTSEPEVNALVFATDPALLTLQRSRPRLPVDAARRRSANEEIAALSKRLRQLMTITNSDLIAILVGCRYATKVLLNRKISTYLKDREPAVYRDMIDAVQKYWNCEFIQFGRA